MIKVLIIDNFDSFTYNIYQYVSQLGYAAEVCRNDEITLSMIEDQNYTHIIISPGPGRPEHAGISVAAIQHYAGKIPILGVCLGHQAIGRAFGADIVKAGKVYHGKCSFIHHNGRGLFSRLKSPLLETRYHSLVIDSASIPDCLEVTAKSDDGVIQAVRHRNHEIYGVQFHPESVASASGREIFNNFISGNMEGNSMKEYIKKIVGGEDLTMEEAALVMEGITGGKISSAQIAAVLTALRIKGASIPELTGFARVMTERAEQVAKPEGRKVADLVGTGGDAASTLNISTIATLVCAGAGLAMAKHGNRSVTSKCGAADLLEALGVNLDSDAGKMAASLDEIGIAFLFAPKLHTSMKHAVPVRRELGIRTVFNILGPLTNPARPDYQVIGVYSRDLVAVMAAAANNLGKKRCLVCHGSDGLDEITLTGKTYAAEIREGWIREFEIDPHAYGFDYCSLKDLEGGGIDENKILANEILEGKKGPMRDVVLLNAGVTLYTAGEVDSIPAGIKMAEESIDSGSALRKLKELVAFTNGGM